MTNFNQLLSTPQKQQGRLPDFIIIGGMKCGTTSLHYYLNCHPEISMTRNKELNFFIQKKNWKKGLEWYQSQFSGDAKIYGEASPNYTNYPCIKNTAKLIYETVPDVKLLYLIRDPIKRIVSHYVHKYTDGKENRNIQEALTDFDHNDYNRYVCRSRYYWQLEQYLKYFSGDNILVLTTEELYTRPQDTLKTVFQFLNVSDCADVIDYRKKLHESIHKRRKTNLGNAIAKFPIMGKINHLPPSLRYHMKKFIYFPFSTSVKKPTIEPDLQERLIDYLKDDITRLQKYTGRDFNEWCV